MPASMAAWISCEAGPLRPGRSISCQAGSTSSGSMATAEKCTVPLAVVRWPMPDQSSTTRTPSAWRGANTSTVRPCSSSARLGIQWANSAPVE
ncbi:hypothetical protein D3C78_1395560 [compost metagenome]